MIDLRTLIRVLSCGQLVSSVVISSNGEARRVCYLQAAHRDIVVISSNGEARRVCYLQAAHRDIVVISSNGEARRVCYLQAHRDIHRPQLLEAPCRDTCCEVGGGEVRDTFATFFFFFLNCNAVLNLFFFVFYIFFIL